MHSLISRLILRMSCHVRLFLARGFVESASPKICLQEAPNMTAFVSRVPAIKVNYVYEFGHLDWPSVGEKQQLKPP